MKIPRWQALLFFVPILVLGVVVLWFLRVERDRVHDGLFAYFQRTVENWDEADWLDPAALVRVPESVFEPGWKPVLVPPDASELLQWGDHLAKFEEAKRLVANEDYLAARTLLDELRNEPEIDQWRVASGLRLRPMVLRLYLDAYRQGRPYLAQGDCAEELVAESFRLPNPLSAKMIEDACSFAYPKERGARWMKQKELLGLFTSERAVETPAFGADGRPCNGPESWTKKWSREAPWLKHGDDWWFADFSNRNGSIRVISLVEVEAALFSKRDKRNLGYSGEKGVFVRFVWNGNILRDGLAFPIQGQLASAKNGSLEVFLLPASGYDWNKRVDLRVRQVAWKLWVAWGIASLALVAAWLIYRERARMAELESNFIASVSHELRTPVASIGVLAERLESGKVPQEDVATYHRLISREGQRLAALIDNVLDFSRIHQDRKEYEFKEIDFHRLAKETVDFLQPYAEQKNLTIDLVDKLSETALTPEADAIAIRQVLVNLIDNAIKFSPTGGAVVVTLDARYAGGVELWVEDSGKGIPIDEQRRIFKQFYRSDNGLTRETTGAGIGLSIVKHVVKAHGGLIEIQTSSSGGAKFVISLPGPFDPDENIID